MFHSQRSVYFLLFSLAFFLFEPAHAAIAVRIDTSFADEVLLEVCSGKGIDEEKIRGSAPAQSMVGHFSQFRDYFTMDAYVEARRSAAECRAPEKDYFRIAEVIANMDRLKAEISELKTRESGLSERTSSMLEAYSPQDIEYEGLAVPVIGSPSCGGWSAGETFYVDLPCINGDNEGLLYLIAHETYHGVQNLFMPDVSKESSAQTSFVFSELIREGLALTVADLRNIKNPGPYAKLNQRIASTNAARVEENFSLLAFAFHYLLSSNDPGASDAVYNVGFSGLFDSPFYYIGAIMGETIDRVFGRQALICILSLPPEQYPLAYEAARRSLGAGATTPGLGAPVIRAARNAPQTSSTFKECL